MRESIIQSNITNAMQKADWMVIKLIQTNVNGIPDLLCLKNGRTVFIEVKQPGNKPRDLQLYRHDQLRKQGFEVLVATNHVDVFSALSC